MGYSGAGGKLIREKNQKQKILWHCPFKPGAWGKLIHDKNQNSKISWHCPFKWTPEQSGTKVRSIYNHFPIFHTFYRESTLVKKPVYIV